MILFTLHNNKGDDHFVVLDFEHELIKKIVELFFAEPKFDPQADNMEHESQRLRFRLLFILTNFIHDKTVIPVVALL